MKNIHLIILAFAVIFPVSVWAQTEIKNDAEFGARVAVSVDKKIAKSLHVSLEEEVRLDNNFTNLDRLQTTLELNYKVHRNIKLGVGYSMINGYSPTNQAFKNTRHRFMADVTGTLHFDHFNISLKERFQVTHRTGDFNPYQNPKNALMLKSRLMFKLKCDSWEPYAYVEMRNYLNAPVIAAAYDGTTYCTLDDNSEVGEAGWFLMGFNGSYINRWRGSIGTDIKLNKHHTINIYAMADYCIDKVVDANAEGTKLKSYTKETCIKGWLGARYEFSF